MGNKKLLLLCIGIVLVSHPMAAIAQTPPQTTPQTQQVLSRFNPGITSSAGGGDTFSGLNFSGVGGAVLSCTNIGESVASTVGDLFKSAKKRAQEAAVSAGIGAIVGGASGEEQPVTDKKVTEQLKKQTQRENCLNAVAYAVAKNMLQQVTNRTLTWINTGLSGNPLYVRDTNSFLKNIRDQKINEYLGTVVGSDPIFGNALRSTITQQVTGYTDGRLNKVMDTPEGRAYQDFQNDFTQGGWNAFLNPKNNAVGAYFNAVDTLSSRIGTAEQNTKDELAQGNGFLSVKKCVEWDNGITRPTVQADCTAQYAQQKSADIEICNAKPNDILKNGCMQSVSAKYTTLVRSCVDTDAHVEGATATCTREETVTPGSVIAAQAATITTTSVRQLEQADQINEVLGSFFDQLLSRLFSDGLGGLSGRDTAHRGTNVVLGSNGLALDSANATSAQNAFGYQQISGGFNGEFDISRPQQLRAIIKTQLDFVNRTKDSRVAMSRIIPTLGKLDYCIPGPNPSWNVGTDYNAELVFSALAGKPPSKALGNTISTLSSAAAAIPGPGWVIAIVGNVVGAVLNIGGGDEPTSIETHSLKLFDKVTNGARQISDFYMERGSFFDDISLIGYLQDGYRELITAYKTSYDPEIITGVLKAADHINPSSFSTPRTKEMMDEANSLVYYDQNIASFDKINTDAIGETEDAILKLNSINVEIERIVADAKKRYIRDNPSVNMACLNNAYSVTVNADNSVPDVTPSVVIPATGATRFESDTIDPMVLQSKNARIYFYSHL